MKESKKKEIEDHNRKFDKLQVLRAVIKGQKDEWIVKYFGNGMNEEQIDRWIAFYGETK